MRSPGASVATPMNPDVDPTLFGLSSVRTSPPRLVSAGTSSSEQICTSPAGACVESELMNPPVVVGTGPSLSDPLRLVNAAGPAAPSGIDLGPRPGRHEHVAAPNQHHRCDRRDC